MIEITSGDPDCSPPYEHLTPIIALLMAHGNEPADKTRSDRWGFYLTQGGWQCDLARPIDFGLVDRSFQLPPSITLNPKNGTIFCKRTWIELSGPRMSGP